MAAAEQAIKAAGHEVVDIGAYPSMESPSAAACRERVLQCDLYVGVLGTRYGSGPRGLRDVSYAELEFDTATGAGIPRLVFLLDTASKSLPIPPSELVDSKNAARQESFVRRVRSSVVTRTFDTREGLASLVAQSLSTWSRARPGPRGDRKPRVFISYGRADKPYAARLAESLERAGVHVWYDHAMVAGTRWADAIEREIIDCTAVVVLMTEGARASDWVAREVNLAEQKSKVVVPLLLSGEAWFTLNNIHYIDVRDGRLPGQELVERLRRR